MLSRLETMVLSGLEIPLSAIRGQIAGGIDILVHLGRLRNKKRVVLEISELDGIENGEIVLRRLFKWNGYGLERENELKNVDKLMA